MTDHYRIEGDASAAAKALAAVQKDIQDPVKDKANDHFRSKYADIAGYLQAARPVLAAHGIALTQLPFASDGNIGCTTVLLGDGWQLHSTLSVPMTKYNGPQQAGSGLTYVRRYALGAILGMAADDDDGNAAQANGNGSGQKPAATGPKFDAKKTVAAFSALGIPEPALVAEFGVALAKTSPQQQRDLRSLYNAAKSLAPGEDIGTLFKSEDARSELYSYREAQREAEDNTDFLEAS